MRQGLPHLIDHYSVREDVLTRMFPFMALIVFLELFLSFGDRWSGVGQAIAFLGGVALMAGAFALVNRLRRRPLWMLPDTVGVPETSRLAVHGLIKMGRYVVVGLHGGDFKMPLPWLPQKALTVRGSYVGSCKDLRELIELVKTGKVKEIPVSSRPLSAASETLEDLKQGKITGRVVLNAD